MSIFKSYALPMVAANSSKTLLELLRKNNISPDSVHKVVIGPRCIQLVSAEIAGNVLLTVGEFVKIFLYEGVYYSGVLSDS